MALPSSGSISLGQVNTELGVSATSTRSLNDTTTRNLFGVGSGTISLSQGYGKANQFAFTISSNQTNANLRTLAVNAGWNQSSKVVATIDSGVYISSNSTSTPALTIIGSFPGSVDLINNGTIVGDGGNGGTGGGASGPIAGGSGGTALEVSVAVSITNNGIIAGGGGGGGGGGFSQDYEGTHWAGGGGGGGGRSGLTNSSGGAGGTRGPYIQEVYPGYAGGAGTINGAGAGGPPRQGGGSPPSGAGGSGGTWGSPGGSGGTGKYQNVPNYPGAAGGAGGKYVTGNANVTWVATGTRYGGYS